MNRTLRSLLLILVASLLLSSSALARGPAPEGRTYLVMILGLGDDPLSPQMDCLTFGPTRACTPGNQTCLSWQRTAGGLQTNKESGFSLAAELDDDGLIVTLEGQGRVDSRGPKSSISAVARAAALDVQLNFALAGRQTSQNRCIRLVEEFEAGMSTP